MEEIVSAEEGVKATKRVTHLSTQPFLPQRSDVICMKLGLEFSVNESIQLSKDKGVHSQSWDPSWGDLNKGS